MTPSELNAGWQEHSVRVGGLWFVDAKGTGIVRLGRPTGPGRPKRGPQIVYASLFLQYSGDTTTVLKPAPGAAANFTFNLGGGYIGDGVETGIEALPPGETGFTFARCPAETPSPGGQVATFSVAFSIVPGTSVPVEVLTSPSAQPTWLTFTAPPGIP
jgi:hypothetical protein